MQTQFDPNILALLAPHLRSGGGLPQFAPGNSGIDPNLGALLIGAGFLPKHQNMQGQYMLPGQEQGGLDHTTFPGLDALHSMQQGRSARYSAPSFVTPEMGLHARVSQSPDVYNVEQRPPGPYQTGPALTKINMQPTAEENAQMAQIRQSLARPQVTPSPSYLDTPQFAQTKQRWDSMQKAFAQPWQKPQMEPVDSINKRIAGYQQEQKNIDTQMQGMKGYPNFDAYAQNKIHELDPLKQRMNELVGRHQADMRQSVQGDNAMFRNYGSMFNPSSVTQTLLQQSQNQFGVQPGTPTPPPLLQRRGRGTYNRFTQKWE